METLNNKTVMELKELMGGDVAEVYTAFRKSSDHNLTELAEAIKNKDIHKIERSSHSLKGSSANIGADLLSQLCAGIVEMARNQIDDGYDDKLIKVNAEYSNVLEAISKSIDS